MLSALDVPPLPPLPEGGNALTRATSWVARWLDRYSRGVVGISAGGAVIASLLAFGTIVANVFCRYALDFSLIGSDELASYAFLWTIWLGVSVAVRRGAVTVITVVSDHGPMWWRRSLRVYSSAALTILLVYCMVRATQYAASDESVNSFSTALGVRQLYPIASMTIGYYFISLHYATLVANALARAAGRGRASLRPVLQGVVGGAIALVATWGISKGMLAGGVNPLVVIGVIFILLTLAGTPVVFMLSIVGILSATSVLGVSLYPVVDPFFPFRTTQNTMGLNGTSELLVILMFLIVAEVMNQSGMSDRLIHFAASLVGHLRGGMAYVCQITSMMIAGISGSAQADAAIMTPLLVPAMEKEGYPRDVAAAVVAGASLKGPIGPISIMFIVYGVVVQGPAGASINHLLLSGISADILLFLFQAATVYVVVRRRGFFQKRRFAGPRAVVRTGGSALPVLAVPAVIVGGIFGGVFTPSESAAVALLICLALAFFWYGTLTFRDIPRVLAAASVETGIVMLLLGDSSILATNLNIHSYGAQLESFLTGITHDKYVFLLVVNLLLLAVGIFIEPLPALYILGPLLAQIAVVTYGVDPVQFGLIMVFNLVLALIHPPVGLVLFLVSSIAKVSIERLSITVIPWIVVSLVVLALVTYLPAAVVLWLPRLFG